MKAPYALLMDARDGRVLFEKRGHVSVPPASTTKIAVLLYALELLGDGDLDQEITIPPEVLKKMEKRVKQENNYKIPPYWLESDGMSIDLLPGETISLRALFEGAMIWSANDAANAIAYHFGGSIPAFMEGLNAYLKQIGCNETHYDNPNGLFFPTHKSSAYDLALMAKEARRFPILYEIAQKLEFERPKTNKRPSKVYNSYNGLLIEGQFHFPHATGFKTGYIEDAGFCVVATAETHTRSLIAVVLKEEDKKQRWRDAITLFNAAFEEQRVTRPLYIKEETAIFRDVDRGRSRLRATIPESIEISYYPSTEPKVRSEMTFMDLQAPIKKGQKVGHITVYDETHSILASTPLIADDAVEEKFISQFLRECTISKMGGGLALVGLLVIGRRYRCQIQLFLRNPKGTRLRDRLIKILNSKIFQKFKMR